MNAFAYLMLVVFPLMAMGVVLLRPGRWGLGMILVIGLLFLPIAQIDLPMVNYSKEAALCVALLLGAFVGGFRMAGLRPSLMDLVMTAVAVSGGLSALANANGTYDAVSEVLTATLVRLVPYFVGRALFGSLEHARVIVRLLVLGGLVYLPLCWWELRMSPQLHRILYGSHQHDFVQTLRGSGYRPMVFMPHGLELSLFMVNATLACLWSWRFGKEKRIFGVPTALCFWALALTSVLCKSTGATMLGLLGGVLLLSRFSSLLVASIVGLTFFYIGSRIFQVGVEEGFANLIVPLVSERAASSMFDRIYMETMLIGRAWTAPIFGVSVWGFLADLQMPDGEIIRLVSDSAWIIVFTSNGFFGLIGFLLMFGLPPLRAALSNLRRPTGDHPSRIMAIVLLVVLLDSIANTPENPFYLLMVGSLSSLGGVGRTSGGRSGNAAPKAVAEASPPGARELLVPRARARAR